MIAYIFPFRGITVDLELALSDSFPGVHDTKRRLTEATAQYKECLPTELYFCRAAIINGREEHSYEVRLPSRLFLRTSLLNATLRHTEIEVYVSKRIDAANTKSGFA